jgi:hypothetical protein
MSCDPNKEDLLDALYEEEYEFYRNDGFIGEQACILARQSALYRYQQGQYDDSYLDED